MALRKRTGARFETNTWAGFVDVMTALLLVMIFVLSIFMIMQFFLRETIKGQGRELSSLEGQLATIADVLGATRAQNSQLSNDKSELENNITKLQFEFDERAAQISSFEEQVASLIARNTQLQGDILVAQDEAEKLQQSNATLASAQESNQTLLSDKEKLERALAAATTQISTEEANARLAQERAKALEAMVASFNPDANSEIKTSIEQVIALAALAQTDENFAASAEGAQLRAEVEKLSQLEQTQLADQAATEFLREKLRNSDTELTAMTLALEKERQKAEDTLTLLAALESKRTNVEVSTISQEEKDAALLEIAQQEIALRKDVDAESARRIALLNEQTAQLRAQLGSLQGLLDSSIEQDAQARVQLQSMGTSLNAALARAAAEQKKRADSLESYRSEFFGSLREVLSGVEGVKISGDRFVFSSEVLFPAGSAELSQAGRAQVGKVAEQIRAISQSIPTSLNWVLRVDGHTDIQPLAETSRYADNWELSQARALSVVQVMISEFGVDPKRLAAAGFGEFHPIDDGRDANALAKNRRIELKLTEQ